MAKFCGDCGTKLSDEAKFCIKCGKPFVGDVKVYPSSGLQSQEAIQKAESTEGGAASPVIVSQTNQANNPDFLPVMAIGLVCVSIFLPMFDIWSGFFPTEDAWTAIDTLRELSRYGLSAISYAPVLLHLAAWVPALILLVGLALNRRIAVWGAAGGVTALIIALLLYVLDHGLHEAINLKDGNVGIGYWMTLLLFVGCLIMLLRNNSNEEITDHLSLPK